MSHTPTPNSNEQYIRDLLAKQKPLPLTAAQKIAAHDELVAALQDIVTYVSPGDDVPFAAMLEEARAALAKVRAHEHARAA